MAGIGGLLNFGNLLGNPSGRTGAKRKKGVGLAKQADIDKILSTEAGISRTISAISLAAGGIGGALGGALDATGGAAGSAVSGLASGGGIPGGAGGFLSSIKSGFNEGFAGTGGTGLTVKGFLSGIGKQVLQAKNDAFNIFRNVRGVEPIKGPGEEENNLIGLNPQDFLSSIMSQLGQGPRR